MKVEIDSENLLTLRILAAVLQTGSMSARRKRGRYRRFRLGSAERAVKQPVPAITT
jgi:hypothetical protein